MIMICNTEVFWKKCFVKFYSSTVALWVTIIHILFTLARIVMATICYSAEYLKSLFSTALQTRKPNWRNGYVLSRHHLENT